MDRDSLLSDGVGKTIIPVGHRTTGMDDSASSTENSSGRRIKVQRLIDEYDLTGLGAEMERLWTTDTDDRMSLRALAEYFNQQLLEEAMVEAGLQPLSGEVDNIYQLLTGDDVTSADQTRTRRRLERDGIDVERLLSDFITYQAIRTYLKEHRNAEYSANTDDMLDREKESIQRLRGRMTTVVESKLGQLQKKDELVLGDYRMVADINVYCEDCGTQYGIDDLLDKGGCDCSQS